MQQHIKHKAWTHWAACIPWCVIVAGLSFGSPDAAPSAPDNCERRPVIAPAPLPLLPCDTATAAAAAASWEEDADEEVAVEVNTGGLLWEDDVEGWSRSLSDMDSSVGVLPGEMSMSSVPAPAADWGPSVTHKKFFSSTGFHVGFSPLSNTPFTTLNFGDEL